MKFGGAALQDIEHLKKSCDFIEQKVGLGIQVVVVASAMGDTTNYLLSMADQVTLDPKKRELDMLLSAGERISMALLTMELQSRNISALSFTGSQAGIITNEDHTDAKIIDVRPFRIKECIQQEIVPVIAGFQGVSLKKEITTLGRGGSDTTAVAIAVALKADLVEFYKDVPGVFSNDPKIDSNAILHASLTYDDALNIILKSKKKLLHERALVMAKHNQIPLFVQSFKKDFLPQNQSGSWIKEKFDTHPTSFIYEVEERVCSNFSQDLNLSSSTCNLKSS
jgi:aspartate kinase